MLRSTEVIWHEPTSQDLTKLWFHFLPYPQANTSSCYRRPDSICPKEASFFCFRHTQYSLLFVLGKPCYGILNWFPWKPRGKLCGSKKGLKSKAAWRGRTQAVCTLSPDKRCHSPHCVHNFSSQYTRVRTTRFLINLMLWLDPGALDICLHILHWTSDLTLVPVRRTWVERNSLRWRYTLVSVVSLCLTPGLGMVAKHCWNTGAFDSSFLWLFALC